MKKFAFFALFALFVFSFRSAAYGQATTGTITGTVMDQSGASVAGARVTVTNPATTLSRDTTSAGNGTYRLDALPVGVYTISAEASGFKKSVINDVTLNVNDVLSVDIKMEVGQVSEVVTVTEAPSTVQTETSVVGRIVDNKTLNDLPVLSGAGGRNPLQLAPLQAGVVAAGQVGPFAVNGQRAQSNNFMLDGGDSNDLAINVPDAITGFSPDALQEFRILTNTYGADFGRNSGSIVNVISKSGTNEFHGDAFEYFRNRVLNATPFFNNSSPTFNGLRKPQFNVNEFGGTIGGPVYLPRFGEGGKSVYSGKNRTFFFFSYEGFRRRQGVTSSATVPSQAQRNAVNAFAGTPQQIKNLLNEIPAANSGNNTLLSSAGNRLDRNQFFLRGDSKLTEKNNIFVSYFREHQTFTDPFAFGGSTIPGFGTSGVLTFTNLVVDDTHIFSTKSLNEIRFSYHVRDTLSVVPVNQTSPADLGISGIVAADPAAIGPPRVDLTGFSNWGNTIQGPQGRKDKTLQFVDNFSHTLNAKHSMKFGGEYRKYVQDQTFDFINNGYYIFTGDVTNALGLPLVPGLNATLSDFARGLPVEFVENSAGRPQYNTFSYDFYGLDDWKVTPYLTLNLGLRYEYDEPLYDSQNRVFAFRPGQQSTVFPTAPKGIVYPGDAGITRSTYKPDRNNFGPRVGFAWDMLHNQKLSLRGGWGLYYDTVISETTLQFLTSPPFAIQPFVLFTTVNNPWSNSLVHNIPQPFPFTPVQRGGTFDFTNIAPISMTVNDPNFVTPYSYQYNLNVQWEFLKGYTLEVGYVGSAGHHQLTRREIDPAIAGPGANTSNTDARRVFNQGNPQNAAFGGSVFSGITNQETSSNSVYNSLQATVSHRFNKGFYFQNAYTFGHCIDSSSGLRSNNNTFDEHRDRGNCDQDIRHRNALSAIYELPWFKSQKGALGRFLGGWEMTGVFAAQTGSPFDIVDSSDRSLTGAGDNRPDLVNGSITFLNPRNTDTTNGGNNRFFNSTGGGTATAATNPYFRRVGSGTTFALGAGRFGSMGRNVFHGPGFWNVDMSFIKRTHITEKTNVEFRAEFFNIFNHAQFNNPGANAPGWSSTNIASANFGAITSTRDPRLIQFALKINF
jgi:hypothetical protein